MGANLFKLMLAVIALQYLIAQQISELKCEESLLLSTDPQSLHPHLMEIVDLTSLNEIPLFCSGTLISEHFMLTSYFCVHLSAYRLNQLLVRKAYVLGEHFTNNQRFNIKRIIPYDEAIGKVIGLVELKEAVPYHDSVSVFRPACLWTETFLPPTHDYHIYGRRGLRKTSNITSSRVQVIPADIMIESKCTQNAPHEFLVGVVQSRMCMSSSAEQIQAWGSPMETHVQGRNYVVAIYSTYITFPDANMNYGTKVGSHIAWIESIVWPAWGSPTETDVQGRNYVVGYYSGTITYPIYNLDVGTKVGSHIAWIKSVVWPNFTLCGLRKIKHKPLMAFSLPTYHGEYPWHVALYRSEGDSQKYICGGTIINNRTVITAAHCVTNELGLLPANRLSVVAGIHNLNQYTLDTRTYFVELINVHDDYNRDYLENDIALLKLNDTIRFTNYIQPICFGNNSEFNTTVGRVAGWGHDEQNQPSQILLQATVPIRSNKECRLSNRGFFHTYLNDYNYCGGYQNGTNVCSGDSGGGMIFEYNSRFYIRGIVSVGVALPGSNRCDISQMVLFTDVPKFYNWIIGN